MKCTDACVFPYPDGDTSSRRFALEAKELGYDSIVCINSHEAGVIGDVRVLRGAIISSSSVRDFKNQLKRQGSTADLVLVEAGDAKFNRIVLLQPGVHIFRGIHIVKRRYFDHVAARNAAESGVAIDLDLSPLVHGRGVTRQRVLQCYADILKLQRRYHFPFTISSSARSYIDQRSVREAVRLCSLFGMEKGEVTEALGAVGHLLTVNADVEVIE